MKANKERIDGFFFILLSVLMMCSFYSLHAQSSQRNSTLNTNELSLSDSLLVIEYFEKSKELRLQDLGKSKIVLLKGLEIAKQIGYKRGEVEADYLMGTIQLYEHDLKSATKSFSRAMSESKKYGFKKILSSAYNNYGQLLIVKSDFDSSLYFFQKSLAIEEKLNDPGKILKRYNNIATSYYHLSKYEKAIHYYFRGLEIAEDTNDSAAIAGFLNNLGKNYSRLQEYELATKYYRKGLLYTDVKHVSLMSILLVNLGDIASKTGDYSKALSYFQRLINITQENDHGCYQTYGWAGSAEIFLKQKNNDSAKVYAQKAREYAIDCDFTYQKASANYVLAQCYMNGNQFTKAEKTYNEALEALKDKDDAVSTIGAKIYLGVSEMYAQTNRFEKSLKFYKLYKVTQDSIRNNQDNSKLVRMEADHQFQKERELLLKDRQRETDVLETEVSHVKQSRNIIIVALSIFLILAYVLYILYKREGEAKHALSEKNRTILSQQEELIAKADLLRASNQTVQELSKFRESLAHMAVHDMKNPLNTIMGLSIENPSEQKMKIIHKASRQMFNFIANMLDIYKFEKANIVLDLQSYKVADLVDEAAQQVSLLLDEKNISLKKNVDESISGIFDGTIVVRLLINLLTNAIKYSSPGSAIYLSTKLLVNDDMCEELKLNVKDEGVGIEAAELTKIFEPFNSHKSQVIDKSASTGIGLSFCKLAVKAHNGRIEAESEIGRGTTIMVSLPLKRSQCNGQMTENMLENDNKEIPLILEDEHSAIVDYALDLKDYEVYEVGKITPILRDMEDSKIKSSWKNRVQSLVYSGDNDAFKTLLNQTINYGE